MSCDVTVEPVTHLLYRRRHVRCRSHDLSRLPHHLLVSTDVSPVRAITVVRGPGAASWLRETKRRPSSPVSPSLPCHGADGTALPAAGKQTQRGRQEEIRVLNYLLKYALIQQTLKLQGRCFRDQRAFTWCTNMGSNWVHLPKYLSTILRDLLHLKLLHYI